ncbi:MAG: molybdopterin synthase catalytic subunit MoaE [Pseudomonadota bacterium]
MDAPTSTTVSVQTEDFDISAEVERITSANREIGAVVTFTGLVREITGEGPITAMELEHYPGMTERSLREIVEQARTRWPLDAVRLVHRFGKLAPGDRIVLVIAASRHREAAFGAATFLMDYLKTRAPFWKKEHGVEGPVWVDARESDQQIAARWGRSGL